jgi:pSer/pThr/pTyr-binding forkhead associated (FHA) protein
VDNDIVIESPSISRRHAQIRWRYGRFVIYDLGSSGGTQVNGQRVTESVLHNGDVIMLSQVALIYGEGLAEDEQERPRPSNSTSGSTTLVYRRDE